MSVSGPSVFVDPYNVTFTPTVYSTGSSSSAAFSVYGINRISVRQKVTMVYSYDNNKTRPVGGHPVSEETTVDIEFTDMQAALSFQAAKGKTGNLIFQWKPSANQLTTSPLADQTVTIHNLMVSDHNPTAPTKANGTVSISAMCMQMSDNSDPVTFANTGS